MALGTQTALLQSGACNLVEITRKRPQTKPAPAQSAKKTQ